MAEFILSSIRAPSLKTLKVDLMSCRFFRNIPGRVFMPLLGQALVNAGGTTNAQIGLNDELWHIQVDRVANITMPKIADQPTEYMKTITDILTSIEGLLAVDLFFWGNETDDYIQDHRPVDIMKVLPGVRGIALANRLDVGDVFEFLSGPTMDSCGRLIWPCPDLTMMSLSHVSDLTQEDLNILGPERWERFQSNYSEDSAASPRQPHKLEKVILPTRPPNIPHLIFPRYAVESLSSIQQASPESYYTPFNSDPSL